MPILLRDVIQAVAEARNTSVEAVIQTVQSNLKELIRDNPWLEETYARVLEAKQDGG